MGSFSTLLHYLFPCWRPKQPSLVKLDIFPAMTKTVEIRPFGSYREKSVHVVLQNICFFLCEVFRKVIHHCMTVTELLSTNMFFLFTRETVVMTRDSEIKMTTMTVKATIHSDQLAVADALLSDWLECQSEKQDDHRNCETEWSEEEDLSDDGVSEMSLENKELWESFLNNSDPYNPLCISCPTGVKVSDSDHNDVEEEEEEEPALSHQERDHTEWSEEEDSGWSDEEDSEMSPENKALWESFLNNSDSYNPLSLSCPSGDKIKASEVQQNHTLSSPTAREVVDHTPEQSTKGSAKKVRFSEEVTVHTLDAWGLASQAARDGSCWMEMARDRDRFKRRVEKAGEIISPCLTAQHRARVLDRLLSHSELYESSMNNRDLYNPLPIPCPTEDQVCASDNDHNEEKKPLPLSHQDEDNTEWSEEEDSDWSDEDSEMSVENRELWESFLYNSDPFHPLCFSCPTGVKVSDSDDDEEEEEEHALSHQEKDNSEWNEEEDSDWSDEEDSEMSPENKALWESFLNNSDPYNPLSLSCSIGIKIKPLEIQPNHTPSNPTAREVEDHTPEQSTKGNAKKVRFSEETAHTLEAWGCASQAARDGL
ncbi:protein phosphatase 1 regulatory subunit 15A [Hemibagrus wyckioides]|nr:protein phosphatase 1 regulatory subunit 15A [Hemibagrus wyckioides]